ncbi:hypothetical protein [Bradyrhizobium sp.]|jgi:hypothetical protein|uniref:sialidase family protein n=1 Tax=Bradyrhizobium sp. TaxID=376 RepID=UPI002B74E9DB|nr:hypothetical protein [Bradyrhizobium sp.]HWX60788.1 hypothetical protein [Bradyrhizobium sp.]
MTNDRSGNKNSRCNRGVRAALAGLAALPLAWAASASADQLHIGRLVQVTNGDPFANCTSDNLAGQEASFKSTLFPNTAIEPSIAVDPTDFGKVLVGHQQDRWNDGGARGTIGVLSRVDDLDDWRNTIPPGVTQCTGGSFVRSSDPWVTYANDGTAFFFHLTTNPAPGTPFASSRTGMLMSRSTDHGHSWQSPTALIDETTTLALNDKNSVTADWTRTGNVYATWDRLSLVVAASAAAAALPQLGSEGVVIARKKIASKRLQAEAAPAPAQTVTSFGPTLLSRTTNNGVTWSTPAVIYDPGPNNQTINNIVQVTPDGSVYTFFTSIIGAAPTIAIGFVTSTDKGVTWSGPTTAQVIPGNSVVTPDSGEAVRDAGILYSVAVNKRTGALYLVWQDDRFTTATCTTPGAGTIPVDGIAFSQSLDGGRTWSTPIQVNQTPTNANPCRQQTFIPTIAVANDGRHLAVTYYDFRNDTNTPAGNEGTDYFAVECDVGSDCSKAKSWGGEVRMTNASFNILDAPFAEGHFLGDYMSLAPLEGSGFVPIFGIATGPNLTADFTRRIRTDEFAETSSR